MRKWTANDIPDQTGRIAIVTGANSGLGYQTALALAEKGAQVVMACRNAEKGEAARHKIRQQLPKASVAVMTLDLADLASISRFAVDFLAQYDRLDVLINNAGIMIPPRHHTIDGFELQLGTNHLGHFALTGHLLERLLEQPNSRVVTVSSIVAHIGWMRFDDLMSKRRYNRWLAYGQSKLANILFALELQRRLTAAKATTLSVAAHPGGSNTNLQYTGVGLDNSLFQKLLMLLFNPFLQNANMGALPQLYAATAPGVQGGDYYGPNGLLEISGYPATAGFPWAAKNEDTARRLWQESEKLTGVLYEALLKQAERSLENSS
ncbi:MAG: SDR family oxidoreductase [Anaerolineae bacterium]|nr:SDR family oxidoreductase [Anaerolineae bacterium]